MSTTTIDPADLKRNERFIKARARRKAMYGWAFLAPFFLLFLLIFIIPIFTSAYEAFFQQKAAGGAYGQLTRSFVGLDNFQAVIASASFWRGMGRVFLFGAIQIPVMILAALGLALLLDSLAARFQKVYRLLYFLPYAIPGIIAAIIWIYLYTPDVSPIVGPLHELGLETSLFSPSVILWSMANVTTWTYTGYNMLIFYAALQAVPTELYEAARIDGASEWQVTTKIKVPLLSSAVLLSVLLSIIGTIQLFNEPAMFQKVASLPSDYMPMMMALAVKNQQVSLEGATGLGPAAAMSLVMAVIAGVMALAYAFIQRKVAPSD